jgi:pyruvate kinase
MDVKLGKLAKSQTAFGGKKTKIVATIGPSSNTKSVLKKLIEAGVNVVRINFSHGDHKSNGKIINTVKELRKELNVPIGIMADLQGPRIRVGNSKSFEIKKGEIIFISDKENLSRGKELVIDFPGIVSSLKKGDRILVQDGLMDLKVTEKTKNNVKAEVINGGKVNPRKGINIPDTVLKFGAVTKKDEDDLNFALEQDVDFVALSFVSNGREMQETKRKMAKILGKKSELPQLIAKIERKEAIKNIDEIIKASDVVMVARGDLGIEMDESNVVIWQKEITGKCLHFGKPVIVATQMLESMINNPRPTRAEVSDVSNAVIDHTDAVMLSGETANGKYPVETVKMMTEIIKNTEYSPFDDLAHGFLDDKKSSISAAVAQSAHELMKDSNAKAVLVASISGFTARMIARHRPEQRIFVMTNSEKTSHQLSLVWGAESFVLPDCKDLESLIDLSIKTIKKNKLVSIGDLVVIVAGRPHARKEHMSLVKVEEIK